MRKIKLLAVLLPFALSACGGGGSAGGNASSTDTGTSGSPTTTTKDITPEQQLSRNIDDFIAAVQASHAGVASDSLTGIWIEASGKVWNESGYRSGASFSDDHTDTIYKVHFVMDNGNSVDVSDCSKALTLYSFHFDDSNNIIWSNFTGDTKPTGVITNNTRIDFGTTDFSSSTTTASATVDTSGKLISRWIKLSGDLKATTTIGALSGFGIHKDISCTGMLIGEGTVNGAPTQYYSVDFRDTLGNWLSTDDTSGSPAPTRSGTEFDMTYTGTSVRFTLQ